MANKTDEKAIIFKSGSYYWCKCESCGWEDSSEYAAGGDPIADTGDYDDPRCPLCWGKNLEAESKYVTEDTYEDQLVEIPLRQLLAPYLKLIKHVLSLNDKLQWELEELKNKFGDSK